MGTSGMKIIALEKSFGKARQLFVALEDYISKSAQDLARADQVESGVLERANEICRQLMTGFFEQAGVGDKGESIEHEGSRLKRLGLETRRYVSVFGEVAVQRYAYAKYEKKKAFAPLDRDLALPEREHSYVLQEWIAALTVNLSFDESVAFIRKRAGVNLSKKSAEQFNADLAEYVVPFRKETCSSFSDDGELLVVSADGKGVPIRCTLEERYGLPETAWQRYERKKEEKKAAGRATRRLGKGQIKVRKQMAYVRAVYTINPQPRTSDEVMGEFFGQETLDRPRPLNKRVHAVMTDYQDGKRIDGQKAIFADLKEQVRIRDPESNKTLICLMDGQRSLWEQQRECFPNAVTILDIFHVSERLWDAAYCFHKQGSREAEEMVEKYYKMLLDGRVDSVIRSLANRKRFAKQNKHTMLESVIKYYKNNRNYMRYDKYLNAGYPIGSGPIEGACRNLVKDRMERTGMRWHIQGAQAMLRTRSAYLNDEWQDLIEFRIQQEQHRIYGKAG